MKIIGLTGGIASGKSTVSNTLANLGAIVLDADKIYHQTIEVNKPAWKDLVNEFGDSILNPDKTINRDKLASIVFNDVSKLKRLGEITHPRVMECFKNEMQKIRENNPDAVVVKEIPLLYENNLERVSDEVWVVWVNKETQVKRLMERNSFSHEEALKRIAAQIPLDEKAKRADKVIDNSFSIEETIRQTSEFFKEVYERN